MLAYVGSPYGSILENGGNVRHALELARKTSLRVKDMGYVPISPVLLFCSLYDEKTQRKAVMNACFSLLLVCDVFVYVKGTEITSLGIREELEFAKRNKKDIVCLEE